MSKVRRDYKNLRNQLLRNLKRLSVFNRQVKNLRREKKLKLQEIHNEILESLDPQAKLAARTIPLTNTCDSLDRWRFPLLKPIAVYQVICQGPPLGLLTY